MCINLSIRVCSFTYHSLIIIYIPHFRLKDDGKVDIHKEVLANEANPVIYLILAILK